MEPDAIPPAPKWPEPAAPSASERQELELEVQRRLLLEQELARTQGELEAMQSLLEELPALFESKFQQRLEPMLQQQQRLLEDNALLRQQLLLQPSSEPSTVRLLPAQKPDRDQLRQTLRHAFGFRRAA